MKRTSATGPAYRIVTERLILRCWQPVDAPLLKAAVDESLEHLRPWMPWITQEPESAEAKAARIRRWRGEFDLDRDYTYGVFSADESTVLGSSGLHRRSGGDTLEIGYWIHAEHVRKGYATELSAALTRAAFELHDIVRVEIRCDPLNAASAAVPARLGFTHEGTLRQQDEGGGRLRDTMVWALLRSEYPGSPPATSRMEAYGADGRRLL